MDKTRTLHSIIRQYSEQYTIILLPNKSPMSLPEYGIIFIDKNKTNNPTSFFIFTLLHEIGHCTTYENNQYNVTKEFLATQWAINNSKEWKIRLASKDKKMWQDYIYSFTKAKDKSKYQLDWSPMERG